MPVPAARPDPEVVAVARRRKFSAGEKRALLAEADRCKAAGTLGAFPPHVTVVVVSIPR